ncbi:hypothetical protein WMW72_15595 [Paenibacillus filicis]|uniref:Uncharacterized protein n=1 Tax=Paenibacillus filicis TaxID=669464 RepID=A0ABU9DMM9_9BACL
MKGHELEDVLVTETSSCYNDYVAFKAMSPDQLQAIQKQYYTELHALRDELDGLLNELRTLLKLAPEPYLKSA